MRGYVVGVWVYGAWYVLPRFLKDRIVEGETT